MLQKILAVSWKVFIVLAVMATALVLFGRIADLKSQVGKNTSRLERHGEILNNHAAVLNSKADTTSVRELREKMETKVSMYEFNLTEKMETKVSMYEFNLTVSQLSANISSVSDRTVTNAKKVITITSVLERLAQKVMADSSAMASAMADSFRVVRVTQNGATARLEQALARYGERLAEVNDNAADAQNMASAALSRKR